MPSSTFDLCCGAQFQHAAGTCCSHAAARERVPRRGSLARQRQSADVAASGAVSRGAATLVCGRSVCVLLFIQKFTMLVALLAKMQRAAPLWSQRGRRSVSRRVARRRSRSRQGAQQTAGGARARRRVAVASHLLRHNGSRIRLHGAFCVCVCFVLFCFVFFCFVFFCFFVRECVRLQKQKKTKNFCVVERRRERMARRAYRELVARRLCSRRRRTSLRRADLAFASVRPLRAQEDAFRQTLYVLQ